MILDIVNPNANEDCDGVDNIQMQMQEDMNDNDGDNVAECDPQWHQQRTTNKLR